MEELKIQAVNLPSIGFNFEELKAWAQGITERYAGLVVREEDVAGIKSEMAGLNKLKASLEQARKETVRKVSEPIKTFEGQIKEVVGIFEEAYAFLGGQVKAYEEQAREIKRGEVKTVIDTVLYDNKLTGLEIPIQDRWLNKTTPLKTVKAEVEGIVLAHQRELREKAELEQARQDRAVAIEEKGKAMAAAHGFDLPASSFLRLQDLQIPLTEVHTKIEAAYAAKAAANQRDADAKPAQPVQPEGQEPWTAPRPPQAPAARPRYVSPARALTLDLTYDPAKEMEVLAHIRHLESLCITLTRVTGKAAA